MMRIITSIKNYYAVNEKHIKQASKFLSLLLRHQPELIGLELDAGGWANVQELIAKANEKGHSLSAGLLETVVATNDKQRFAFNEDHSRIRASQGHSLEVELNIQAAEPPEYLYHGTIAAFIEAIKKEGLQKMSRQHVHLSREESTARNVGGRRGKPVILLVKALEMQQAGYLFYLSDNDVWLTEAVPPSFIIF